MKVIFDRQAILAATAPLLAATAGKSTLAAFIKFIFYGLASKAKDSGVSEKEKYGALKGGWMSLKRILRCNPFYKGDNYDPVP